MKHKQKRNLKIILIIMSFLILFVAIFLVVGNKTNIENIPTQNDGSSSGGSTDGSDIPIEEGWSFPDFSGLFDWDIPCFWNCGDAEEDNSGDFTSETCKIDADCENTCSNPTYARCNNGDCSCTIPTDEQPTCLDSDVSLATRTISVYEIKGTTQSTADRKSFTDYCTRTDLVEYFCRNGLVDSKLVDCVEVTGNPDGICYDGVCTWIA